MTYEPSDEPQGSIKADCLWVSLAKLTTEPFHEREA